jgi:hypothetical protein
MIILPLDDSTPNTFDRVGNIANVSIIRSHALAKLGITPEQLAAAPQITPQLRMIQQRLRRDGRPRVTRDVIPYGPGGDILISWPYYLASSDSPDAKKVMAKYHIVGSVARGDKVLPIEAYCVSAGVSPSTIFELLVAACVRFGAQACTIIAAVNHPRVVEKSVEMALTDEGIEDRMLLGKATGFLPTPKGSRTIVNVEANSSATANPQVLVAAPPPEQTIRRLVDRLNEARGLPPVVAPTLPAADAPRVIDIDAEPEEDEDEA